jgi:putative membrane protein
MPDQVEDATRRTRLANERTYLAWWRSGLTAYAVSFGAGKIVPGVTDESRWPWAALGAGFAVLGTSFIAYGWWRGRAVEAALRRGDFAPPSARFLALVTAAGVALGLAALVLVFVKT